MPKILLGEGNIAKFNGDAAIIPCDCDLTYKRNNIILQNLGYFTDAVFNFKKLKKIEREKKKDTERLLLKELAAIGYIDKGSAVITKSYSSSVKHYIFIPCIDHNEPDEILSTTTLHKALRAAFTLATLYDIKTLAIPVITKQTFKREIISNDLLNNYLLSLFPRKQGAILSSEEILNVIVGVSKEYDNTSLKEITIYR